MNEGETRFWLELASHLRQSLQRTQVETASTEVPLWKIYLEEIRQDKWTEHEKWEYYLAQVAQEIRRVLAKDPNSIRLDPFLLKWVFKEEKPAQEEEGMEEEVPRGPNEERVHQSKSAWLAFVGLSLKEIENGSGNNP